MPTGRGVQRKTEAPSPRGHIAYQLSFVAGDFDVVLGWCNNVLAMLGRRLPNVLVIQVDLFIYSSGEDVR